MSQPRVIRKYVNRRLYDTQESRYVNLEELRRLIIEGEEIRVVERTTGNDLSLIHISEPTRLNSTSRMPSSA